MGSFMIQSLVGAVVLNRPMQRWGLSPNRTQASFAKASEAMGLRPYRILKAGPKTKTPGTQSLVPGVLLNYLGSKFL
jgi:hypothetical protein